MNINRSVHTASLGLLLGAGLLWTPEVLAVVKVAPFFAHPLGAEGIGLRTQYFAYASVFGDFDTDQDELNSLPLSWSESSTFSGSVEAINTSRPPTAYAGFYARSQVGNLRGFTNVKIEKGGSSAHALVYMQFMDVIRIGTSGKLDFTWSVSGTADRETLPFSSSNFAASSAEAELFVWPFGTTPQTGLDFDFSNYAKTIVKPSGDTHILPGTFSYPAGSRWWVLGQMTVESTASATDLLRVVPPYVLESSGVFNHTARLFIDPDPATPEATFTALSGFNYHASAIPEPPAWMMCLFGMAVFFGTCRDPRASLGLRVWA